jgi:hypothetical protein
MNSLCSHSSRLTSDWTHRCLRNPLFRHKGLTRCACKREDDDVNAAHADSQLRRVRALRHCVFCTSFLTEWHSSVGKF